MPALGVTFPQTEIGDDPTAIRDFAQAAEELGYVHLLAYDHVLGGHPDHFHGWTRVPYTYRSAFHEPFVLFGYLAGATSTIGMITGVIILPQRQAALVAKQAAEVDVLSGGRLRLGVGLGWNHVEYEALGTNFHDRGRRADEQIALMRELWTNELVTFEGRWHKVHNAGLNPLPVQRPIPVWFGGHHDGMLRRVARLGDGWFPLGTPDHVAPMLETLREYIRHEGRDPGSVGVLGGASVTTPPDELAKQLEQWDALGVREVTLTTMGAGLAKPDDHIGAIRRVAAQVEVSP